MWNILTSLWRGLAHLSVSLRRPPSQFWTGTGGELILLPHFWTLTGGEHGSSGWCVCSRPVSRQPFSTVRRRLTTRWRADSTVFVSPEQPLLRGLPEGEDILFADHNTQTKPFMAWPDLLHLHRKHPLLARKTLFQLLVFYSTRITICLWLLSFAFPCTYF